jgi:hypothetical protein
MPQNNAGGYFMKEKFGLSEVEKGKREQILAAIAEQLPPVTFRNWKRWGDVLPFAPGTVANDDSLGTGPKERVFVGRVCGYPKAALVDYMRGKMRFTA